MNWRHYSLGTLALVATCAIVPALGDPNRRRGNARGYGAVHSALGYTPDTCFTISPGINNSETVIYLYASGVLADCSAPTFGSYPRQVTLAHFPDTLQYEVGYITGCDGTAPTAHTLSRGSPSYAYSANDLVCVTGGVSDAGADASTDAGVGADGGDASASDASSDAGAFQQGWISSEAIGVGPIGL